MKAMPLSSPDSARPAPRHALVLTGGGARVAYQIGVLKALAEWVPAGAPLPFRIVCGTSAGAIIGAILAAHAADFRAGVATLEQFWSHIRVRQVWRNDAAAVVLTTIRTFLAVMTGGWLVRPPHSLLDNRPLRTTLEAHVNFARVQQSLQHGLLDALAVVAAPYRGGPGKTFYMASPAAMARPTWPDSVRTDLAIDHLLASAAVPFLFPAVRLDDGYYGDGSMRQFEPLLPVQQLGAERILVISLRARPVAAGHAAAPVIEPSAGQIAGYMLDSLFMSGLAAELQRLEQEGHPRPLVIEPSEDPAHIAARHQNVMPAAVRLLMRVLGAANEGGQALLSYLLFDQSLARELIGLGYRDALQQRAALQSFLGSDECRATTPG